MNNNVKRALVMSGGGAKGSWSLGALKALVEEGRTWNSAHGVSVGALNASYVSMFKPEEQGQMMPDLLEVWGSIKTSNDIYKPWLPFKLNYIAQFWKGSLYTGAPLKTLVSKLFVPERAKTSGVKLTVGCTSLTDGSYKWFDQSNEKITDYVIASAYSPIVFEPYKIGNELLLDGGIRHQVPILEALKEDPDEIDVILTEPLVREKSNVPDAQLKSLLNVSLMSVGLFSNQVYLEDCLDVVRVALGRINSKKPIKVRIYAPMSVPGIDSMNFDGPTMQKIIEVGYQETKAKIEGIDIPDFSDTEII